MRRVTVILIILAAATIWMQSSAVKSLAQRQSNEPVIPIEGLDPVLLSQGKEAQGDMKISVIRGRFQYLFATPENKAIFEKDPGRYEIQIEGHCARMGPPTTGNPDLFTVHKGRIYVFGSENCKQRFDSSPDSFIESNAPPSVTTASPEAKRKGQALIEKALEAMGGAARVDSLVSYQERSVSSQTRRAGDVEVKTDMLIAFPDRIRIETAMPDYNDATALRKQVMIITPLDSFVLAPRGLFPVPNSLRAEQQKEIARNLISLLRSRKSEGFSAAHRGQSKVGDTSVEEVSISLSDIHYTLGIDTATGRILSLSYRRRGPQGNFGNLTQTFSDFRAVDGLTLPFKITSTFEGEPWKEQSKAVESISINGNIDSALFEKPGANK